MPAAGNKIYLTFDDGPHPVTTPLVLDILAAHHAKATFFCLGENIESHPEIFMRLLAEGHAVGNHSYSHPDGWRTETGTYCDDVHEASQWVSSSLFRPPYGRITPAQAKRLRTEYTIVMWNRLGMDYSAKVDDDTVVRNCTENLEAGSIIVLHDHAKTIHRMPRILPVILEKIAALGMTTELITPVKK